MKIFISWSGTSSRMVAEALNDWLQRVIQAVKPFYSPDIDKGAKWSNEIDSALEGTRFGIICLTPDNLNSNWVHYEAGALSKTQDASIWTFLLDLKPSDVKQPLGRFQHTLTEKSDMLKMLKSINKKLSEVGGEPLRENLLDEIFEETWTKLEEKLNQIKESIKKEATSSENDESVRSEKDKMDEMLEILRNLQRDSPVISNNTYNIHSSSKESLESPVREARITFPPNTNKDRLKGIISRINENTTLPPLLLTEITTSENGVALQLLFNTAVEEKILLKLISKAGFEKSSFVNYQFIPF